MKSERLTESKLIVYLYKNLVDVEEDISTAEPCRSSS
jgi:hypothetical protein